MQQDELSPQPSKPTANPLKTLSPYVTAWAGLAVVALGYITVAVARPDILGAPSPQTIADNNRALQSKTDEAEALADKLARMEQDLQSSQSENAQRAEEKKSHLERIAALEAKAARAEAEAEARTEAQTSDPFLAPADTATASSKQAADEIADRLGGAKVLNDPDRDTNTTTLVKQAAKSSAEKEATAAAKSAATSVANTKSDPAKTTTVAKTAPKEDTKAVASKTVVKEVPVKVAAVQKPKPAPKPAAQATSKIKTGSVGKAATQPITFGPAIVTRATKPIGVRIATGPSVDSLRLSWNALADRHGDSLRRLQPRYVTGIDATGLTYDLIAGPFNTANEASQVCARLHANGARCSLGEFTGNAL